MIPNYEKVKKIIYENEDLSDYIENINYELIEKGEKYLDIKFPNTFKQYLKDFGSLTFGATEIYGVIDEDFINSSIPKEGLSSKKRPVFMFRFLICHP